MKQIHELLNKIRNSSSKLAKQALLEEGFKSEYSEFLQKVLNYTYNPFINYGIKNFEMPFNFGCVYDSDVQNEIVKILDTLSLRYLTGNAARDALSFLLGILSEEDAELLAMIIKKDLRAGFSTSTINKAFGSKLIPTFELQQCHSLNSKTEKKLQYPCYVQRKYDASRVCVIVKNGVVQYFSRNGNHLELDSSIDKEFIAINDLLLKNTDIVFDGEIYVIDKNDEPASRTISNGIINKLVQGTATQEEMDSIGVTLWDVVTLSDFNNERSSIPYSIRLDILFKANIGINLQKVKIAKTNIANNKEELLKLACEEITNGQEGIIAKNMNAPWEAKRTNNCLKVKAKFHATLKVVDIEEGTGKNEGKLGAIVCETSCGKIQVSIGGGLSDIQREEFWNDCENIIGKFIEVEYNSIVTSKKNTQASLFLPEFLEIRNDVNEADSLEKLESQTVLDMFLGV